MQGKCQLLKPQRNLLPDSWLNTSRKYLISIIAGFIQYEISMPQKEPRWLQWLAWKWCHDLTGILVSHREDKSMLKSKDCTGYYNNIKEFCNHYKSEKLRGPVGVHNTVSWPLNIFVILHQMNLWPASNGKIPKCNDISTHAHPYPLILYLNIYLLI